ncbi:hypothetical protein [Telluribacter sp. SYSU D00476]|uniref:hypothetical protein n=1 Tax=Telluribacter sp. SYSU D00476 TaxID=2811430 RepID=UPI001FF118B1|nr:hypothetical protein [Telluribacter sp. SYSU D00476]
MNYKSSYFEQLTQEATTIELDYVDYDRWGEPEYDEDEDEDEEDYTPEVLIRASRYCSRKDDNINGYDVFINAIAQHTLSELTLLPDEVVKRVIQRLQQIDERINDAWKILFEHWDRWSKNSFSSLDFEWKFFHFFNIPITRSTGAYDDPHFEKGRTTDSFFWDLHDAMMYKQGAVKWLIWYLKEQTGLSHEEDETDPRNSEQPSPDKSKVEQGPQNQHVFALLCLYIGDEKRESLAEEYGVNLSPKQVQIIDYYRTSLATERTGEGEGYANRKPSTRKKDFEKVIKIIESRGDVEALKRVENEYSMFLETLALGER